MAEFIVNPRRAPRAPARCRAAVVSTQGWFEAETEDIGSMGCQVVSPKLVRKGELVQLARDEREGRGAAQGDRARRVGEPAGAAGASGSRSTTGRRRRAPAGSSCSSPPTRGSAGSGGSRTGSAPTRPSTSGRRPRFLLDFNGDEAMLLRAIASGARIDELMARLRDRWPAAQRALFSLIARQALTFQRGQAVHPESWKKILTDVEASFAVESMGKGDPAVVAPLAAPLRSQCRRARARPARGPPAARRHPAAARTLRRDAAQRAYESSWPAQEPHDPSRDGRPAARRRGRRSRSPRRRPPAPGAIPRGRAARRLRRRRRRVAQGARPPQPGGAGGLRPGARRDPGGVRPRRHRAPAARAPARARRPGDRGPAREARLQGPDAGAASAPGAQLGWIGRPCGAAGCGAGAQARPKVDRSHRNFPKNNRAHA